MGSNKITSDQFQYDMSAWLGEKSENSLERALEILKAIRSPDQATQNKVDVEELVYDLLFDLTKIFSFSNGTEWEFGDRDIISKDPERGMEALKKKYGMIEYTTEDLQRIRLSTFIVDARLLIRGPRAPNRTFLHELINKYDSSNEIIGKIEDDLYLVTNNEKPWEEFVVETERRLQLMESELH